MWVTIGPRRDIFFSFCLHLIWELGDRYRPTGAHTYNSHSVLRARAHAQIQTQCGFCALLLLFTTWGQCTSVAKHNFPAYKVNQDQLYTEIFRYSLLGKHHERLMYTEKDGWVSYNCFAFSFNKQFTVLCYLIRQRAKPLLQVFSRAEVKVTESASFLSKWNGATCSGLHAVFCILFGGDDLYF